MKVKTIAIIGLGLMGGSLAAACRKRLPSCRIIGISRQRQVLRQAIRKKWIHEGVLDLKKGVSNADLIILCTPIDTLPRYLNRLDRLARSGTLVTDVGSFKNNIRREITKKKWKRIRFISAHPMMGSHEKGFRAARGNLYDRGYIFLIRSPKVPPAAFKQIERFWRRINPRIYKISAQEHDRIVSEISHLPHVLAVCLMLTVSPRHLAFASSGFRDVTRIAKGNPDIWVPIFRANKEELSLALKRFNKQLRAFLKARSRGDSTLGRALQTALRRRDQI